MRDTSATRIKNYYSIAAAALAEMKNAERWILAQPENAVEYKKHRAKLEKLRSDAFIKVYILESLVSRGVC